MLNLDACRQIKLLRLVNIAANVIRLFLNPFTTYAKYTINQKQGLGSEGILTAQY